MGDEREACLCVEWTNAAVHHVVIDSMMYAYCRAAVIKSVGSERNMVPTGAHGGNGQLGRESNLFTIS